MVYVWIAVILVIAGLIFWIAGFPVRKKELPGIAKPKKYSLFWAPRLYSYDGNWYERAVLRNETLDFMLGKGVYHQYERQNCGQHEPFYMFPFIEQYAAKFGNEKMLKMFERDITTLVKQKDLSPEHFTLVIEYIRYYLERFQEGRLKLEWRLPVEIKKALNRHLNNYIALYGTQGGPLDCKTPRNEHYTKKAIDLIAITKERTGIDVLN